MEMTEISIEAVSLEPVAVVEAQRTVSRLSETYDGLAARLAALHLAPHEFMVGDHLGRNHA